MCGPPRGVTSPREATYGDPSRKGWAQTGCGFGGWWTAIVLDWGEPLGVRGTKREG